MSDLCQAYLGSEGVISMEKEYKRLLEEIPDGYFLAQDATIRMLSRPAANNLGYGSESLEGKPTSQLFLPHFQAQLHRAANLESAVRFQSHILTADGTPIPVEASAWSTHFDGEPAVAGVFWDLTERRETEQALRESEETLRVMLESIADGVAVIDLESRILDMNPVMLRLYGYENKADVIGRSALDFVAFRDQPRARENMSKTLREGHSGYLEITLHNKDGVEYDAEVSAAVLKDRDGNPAGFIAITKDITERKQTEEALRQVEELNQVLVDTAGRAGEGLAVLQNRNGEEAVCVFVNDEFARIVGYTVDELMGRPAPQSILYPVRRAPMEAHDPGKPPPRFEFELVRKDGEVIPVDMGIGSTVYREMQATVLYVTDISERKRQESENLQLQETLQFYSGQVVKASKELLQAIRALHAKEWMLQSTSGRIRIKSTEVPLPEPIWIDDVEFLTPREIQVLQLAARGLSNKDIGTELGISVRTVKGHLINTYAKMKVRSRTEAVSCALREGWITLSDMGQGPD